VLVAGGVAAARHTAPPVVSAPKVGEPFWTIPGFVSIGRPGIDESGGLYVIDTQHVVRAFARANQRTLWQTQLPRSGPLLNKDVVVAGGTIIVGDAYLYGLDARSGALRWSFTAEERAGDLELAANDSTVFAGSYLGAGELFAIDAATGTQRWVANVVPRDSVMKRGERFRVFGPVLRDAALYACFVWWQGTRPRWIPTGGIAAVDAASGAVQWSRLLPRAYPDHSTFCSVPAIADEVVVTSTQDGYVYALDRTNGSIRWTAPPVLPKPVRGPPSGDAREVASNGKVVIVGSGTGSISAFSSEGRELWTTTATEPALGATSYHLSIDDTFVYATHAGGQLSATRLSTGKRSWYIYRGDEGFLSTRVVNDTLYATGVGIWAIRTR
jgi:outer membrane protein assembly factor BamB